MTNIINKIRGYWTFVARLLCSEITSGVYWTKSLVSLIVVSLVTEYLHVIFPGKDDTHWKKDSLILAFSTLVCFNGTTSLRARVGALKRGKIRFSLTPYMNARFVAAGRTHLQYFEHHFKYQYMVR